MTTTEKARIAAEIKAFKNTDFSDYPELTDEPHERHFAGSYAALGVIDVLY